jgi:hypothetical protein
MHSHRWTDEKFQLSKLTESPFKPQHLQPTNYFSNGHFMSRAYKKIVSKYTNTLLSKTVAELWKICRRHWNSLAYKYSINLLVFVYQIGSRSQSNKIFTLIHIPYLRELEKMIKALKRPSLQRDRVDLFLKLFYRTNKSVF